MFHKPLVSVVMPAYNAERFIEESIASVIIQTYSNWELIIVDDGSTDNTAAIVRRLQQKDGRITYLWQDRGRQGKARNLAINSSRGELIAFLDADDTWLATKLEKQVQVFLARPEIDLVFCPGYIVSENAPTEFFYVTVKEWAWREDSEQFIFMNQIPILSAVLKRSALFEAGLFIEDAQIQNMEDYHLWIKLLYRDCHFLSIPDFLFNYRSHGGQITKQTTDHAAILLNCYMNLVQSGIIDRQSDALKRRLKWMIFQPTDLDFLYQQMKKLYPSKNYLFSTFAALNKVFPDSFFFKKIAFHVL